MSAGLSTELFKTASTHNPNRKISTAKALEIIGDCAEIGVKAIQFTGGGEPTVHPDHDILFRHAQDKGIETALVSNGVRLDVDSDATLKMAWIRISVDAGTAKTYSEVRRVGEGHWRKVWNKLARLAQNYKGTLGVGYVVTPENYHEIGLAAEKCIAAGVSNMRVGAVFSAEGIHYYKGKIDEIADYVAEAKARYDREGFTIIDLFGRRLSDLESASPEHPFCGYQFFTMYIGGDLGVYRCCNTSYTTRGKIGDLRMGRLRDLVPAYDPFDARGCKFCQFLRQNDIINSTLEQPRHVNFV